MIEVEKKFLLTPEQETSLVAGLHQVGDKTFTDIYYDTADFVLTRQDWWLRQRAGKWELKVGRNEHASKRKGDRYDEYDDEAEILKQLGLSAGEDDHSRLHAALEKSGYHIFLEMETHRRTFQDGELHIDIDDAVAGDFTYRLAEIEIGVDNPAKVDPALERIIAYAKAKGLALGVTSGKIISYIHDRRPEHFRALVESGTCQDW